MSNTEIAKKVIDAIGGVENGSPASTFLIVPRIENMSTVLQDFFETF